MVRRLAGAAAAIHMPEPEPGQIQRADIRLDRPHRIVRLHIVSHARRQKARLLTAHAGLELAIRHLTNLKSTASNKPKILAQPRSVTHQFLSNGGLRAYAV